MSGNGSAAVSGGVAEALALLVTLGGRLPEPSCGKGRVRSSAVQSAREHQHRCGAHGSLLLVQHFGAVLDAHVHLHLCMVWLRRGGSGWRCAPQVDEAFVQRNSAAVRRRVK